MLRYFDLMEKYGANLGMPHTKALGNGLFELRIKAKEGISRVFYCTVVEKEIVMLHYYIKKTQQIPKKEIEVGTNRMKEIKKLQ